MNHDHAKRLRQHMTQAERLLWRCLREHRLTLGKFRRQQSIGRYIVDFVNFEASLILEADGGQHNESSADAARDAWLQEQGFKVLRFWDNDILSGTDAILEKIFEEVKNSVPLSPRPSDRSRASCASANLGASLHGTARGEGRRAVRSYVLRQGRMTDAQRRALETLWPRYGVELT
ncbi:MAG: DUF559 domain-containing protein, partial [Sulfurifustis sp.]